MRGSARGRGAAFHPLRVISHKTLPLHSLPPHSRSSPGSPASEERAQGCSLPRLEAGRGRRKVRALDGAGARMGTACADSREGGSPWARPRGSRRAPAMAHGTRVGTFALLSGSPEGPQLPGTGNVEQTASAAPGAAGLGVRGGGARRADRVCSASPASTPGEVEALQTGGGRPLATDLPLPDPSKFGGWSRRPHYFSHPGQVMGASSVSQHGKLQLTDDHS